MRSVRRRLLMAILSLGILGAACSRAATDADADADGWNAERSTRGFDDAANQRARSVLDRLERAGVPCADAQTEDFDALVPSYRQARLPLPLGSASCTGPAGENLLVEVFRTAGYPAAGDFVERKRALICARGFELGARPDGTNDFEGVPYVMGPSHDWIIEPDSAAVNRTIAEALELRPRNACHAGGSAG